MKISKSLDYALRSMIHLSRYSPSRQDIHEISHAQNIPISYLSKVMRRLVRFGLVFSQVGPDGGYSLTKSPDQIQLREIFEAIEGRLKLLDCGANVSACSLSARCPQIAVWSKLETSIINVLEQITLKDICEPVKNKKEAQK